MKKWDESRRECEPMFMHLQLDQFTALFRSLAQ